MTETNYLAALVELANLTDEPKAIKRFLSRWPDLIPISGVLGIPYIHRVWQLRTELQRDFSNSPLLPTNWGDKDVGYLIQNPHFLNLEYEQAPVELRDILRMIWHRAPEAPKLMSLLLFRANLPMVDLARETLSYTPRLPLQGALYGLLQNSSKLSLCLNPECPAPYFIAKRSGAKFCGNDCAKPAQIEAKKKWWNEHGEDWREGRSKKRGKRK